MQRAALIRTRSPGCRQISNRHALPGQPRWQQCRLALRNWRQMLTRLSPASMPTCPEKIARRRRTQRAGAQGRSVNLEAQENSVHPPALDHMSAVISELASETDAIWWAHTLARQCRAVLDELTFLAPWLLLPAAPDRFSDLPGISGIPTLRELSGLNERLQPVIEQRLSAAATAEERDWLEALRRSITEAGQRANRTDCGRRAPGIAIRHARAHGV